MSNFSIAEYTSASQIISFENWTTRPLKWKTHKHRKVPSFMGDRVDMPLEESLRYIKSRQANALFGYHKDYVVVDFDDYNILKDCKEKGLLPTPLLRVKTYKGEHWYYKQDGSIKRAISQRTLYGIDIRTGLTGNNIVLPGSWHPLGNESYSIIHEGLGGCDLLTSEHINLLRAHYKGRTKSYEKGSRNNTLNERVYRAALVNDHEAIEKERQKAIGSGLSEQEVDATIESAMSGAHKYSQDTIYVKHFGYDEFAKFLEIMDLGMRYDELSTDIQIADLSKQEKEWKPITRHVDDLLLTEVSNKFVTGISSARPVSLDPGLWRRFKNAYVASRMVNPFLEWLEGLPKWDGNKRIAEVFNTPMFTTANKTTYEWNKRVGELLIHGIVMRQLEPGCQFDYVPVLIGPQGCGKTQWVRNITNGEYFTESIDFRDSNADFVRSLMGCVVGEVSETLAAGRMDVARTKKLISRRIDHYRFLYSDSPQPLPRRCIMVATHNGGYHGALPPDDSGYRRWLPIFCQNVLIEGSSLRDWNLEWWAENREQVFAEALHDCKEGVELFLNEPMSRIQEQLCRQVVYQCNPELDSFIIKLIDKVLKIDPQPIITKPGISGFTISQLINMANEDAVNNGMTSSKWSMGHKAIAVRLQAIGYERVDSPNKNRAILWYLA